MYTHINVNTIGTVDLKLALKTKGHKAAVHMHTLINISRLWHISKLTSALSYQYENISLGI